MQLLGIGSKPAQTHFLTGAVQSVQENVLLPAGQKAVQLGQLIGLVKPEPQEGFLAHSYKKIEGFFNYVPDLSTIVEASSRLAKEFSVALPLPLRVAISAFYVLNVVLIPGLIRSFMTAIVNIIPKVRHGGLGGTLESGIKVVYLTGLISALIAVASTGLKDILSRLSLPTTALKTLAGGLFPWIGQSLRLHAILEGRELLNGSQATKDLHKGLHGRLSIPAMIVGPAVRTSRLVNALALHKEFFKRVAGAHASDEHGLGRRIVSIESNHKSWNPIRWMWAGFEANRVAKALETRTASYLTNQSLALTANSVAVMAMVVSANVVASSVLAIIYSLFYCAQAYHRSVTAANEKANGPHWYHAERWLGSPLEA